MPMSERSWHCGAGATSWNLTSVDDRSLSGMSTMGRARVAVYPHEHGRRSSWTQTEYAAVWLPDDPDERASRLDERAETGWTVLLVHRKEDLEREPNDIALLKRQVPGEAPKRP